MKEDKIQSDFQKVLVSVYNTVKKSGILEFAPVKSAFLKGFFFYKSHFEGDFTRILELISKDLQPGEFIDAGANIGWTVIELSKYLQAPHKIHAFEPEAENFKELESTVEKYKLADRVET
jgi:hypothetical protein